MLEETAYEETELDLSYSDGDEGFGHLDRLLHCVAGGGLYGIERMLRLAAFAEPAGVESLDSRPSSSATESAERSVNSSRPLLFNTFVDVLANQRSRHPRR